MNGWKIRFEEVRFERTLMGRCMLCWFTPVHVLIVATVIGEVVCLVHFGYVNRDMASVYVLAATWIKEAVRRRLE